MRLHIPRAESPGRSPCKGRSEIDAREKEFRFRRVRGFTWLAYLLLITFGVLAAPVQGQAPPADSASPLESAGDAEPFSESSVSAGEALLGKLRQGGITVVLLLGVSVVGAACALERLAHLRQSRVAPARLAQEFGELSRAGRLDELGERAAASDSTLGRVAAAMAAHRVLAPAELGTLAGEVATREMKLHLLRAYPLMICATLSPLLGLFGTVAGMIGAFDKVAAAGSLGDASMLGGDISKALITTAAGLVVAIPTLGLYHYFRSRTNLLAITLEEQVGELLLAWRRPAESTIES